MKLKYSASGRLGVAFAGLLTIHAGAQVAPAVSPTESAEPAVTLSPFVVDADRDTGYQATSTLAGTRLNTPIKDLGASISIYTKDLLDDLGATSSSNLLIYATGMETAGPDGNYSGATNDINATSVVGEGPRFDPQQSSRTRGLASPNFSRGLFPTRIEFDSYNTDRVTVNRGPNAILFGIGSPAGVVDTSLLRPDLNHNRNKVEARYGNNDSQRASIDFNRVLIQRKLAIRLAALADNERYNQRPAFQEKRRIYGAVTHEPFKSTALRASFETGRTKANRPIAVLPFNSSEMWDAAGRVPYDWTFFDDPARNPNAATQNAGLADFIGFFINQGTVQNQMVAVHNNPRDPRPAFGFRSEVVGSAAILANAIRAGTFNPIFNRDLASDVIRYYGTQNIFELPAAYWRGANVLPGQQPGVVPAGIKQQGFTNFSVFDFKNRMIDESSIQGDSFHTFNIALEQRAWEDRIGVELAYDQQRIDRRSKNSFVSSGGSNHVRIDPNVTLPTGIPNPNVGRPYLLSSQVNYNNLFIASEAIRATAYLKYDFRDLRPAWAKWLGRHTATGLYEQNSNESISYNHGYAFDGDAARERAPNIDHAGRRSGRIVYIGPSLIGNRNPLQLDAVSIPSQTAGPLTNIPYFGREANATDPGRLVDAPATLLERNNGGSGLREVTRSQAAVLQSHWLQDHFVTMLGWRRDEDYFVRQTVNFVPNPADPNDPGKVHYGFNDFSFPDTPPLNVAGEVRSYSAVARWPRQLVRLPSGTDLSIFYNKSSNFTPVGGRINGYGEKIASPEGDTREYGVNVSALSDKLSLRLNWFETSVKGQSYNPTVVGIAAMDATVRAAARWYTEGTLNPHLVDIGIADAELLLSALPDNYRALYEWRVVGERPNQSVNYFSSLPGRTDTTDYTAKGTELEIVYNPTRNWRILANVAKQETIQSNALPFLKDLITRMTPVWDKLRPRAHGAYPLNWQPGDPLAANVQTFGAWLDANVYSPFATAIATEGSASAEQRKWRANLVTSYRFGGNSIFGERLKGWSIGGAVRWQDKLGIGYPTTRNTDGSVHLDLTRPYYAPAETNVDAFASYERKLWKNRLSWKIQLNVRNLVADDTPIAIGVQPWGDISTVRLAPERRWYVTNSFTF
ncbi:MAG: hypothetical protein Q7S40_17430 [Opitutaceae bacterium]|nr:hypothetical protein [Opitutaceae bacterium]